MLGLLHYSTMELTAVRLPRSKLGKADDGYCMFGLRYIVERINVGFVGRCNHRMGMLYLTRFYLFFWALQARTAPRTVARKPICNERACCAGDGGAGWHAEPDHLHRAFRLPHPVCAEGPPSDAVR